MQWNWNWEFCNVSQIFYLSENQKIAKFGCSFIENINQKLYPFTKCWWIFGGWWWLVGVVMMLMACVTSFLSYDGICDCIHFNVYEFRLWFAPVDLLLCALLLLFSLHKMWFDKWSFFFAVIVVQSVVDLSLKSSIGFFFYHSLNKFGHWMDLFFQKQATDFFFQ